MSELDSIVRSCAPKQIESNDIQIQDYENETKNNSLESELDLRLY